MVFIVFSFQWVLDYAELIFAAWLLIVQINSVMFSQRLYRTQVFSKLSINKWSSYNQNRVKVIALNGGITKKYYDANCYHLIMQYFFKMCWKNKNEKHLINLHLLLSVISCIWCREIIKILLIPAAVFHGIFPSAGWRTLHLPVRCSTNKYSIFNNQFSIGMPVKDEVLLNIECWILSILIH